jgi:hypothetical protein
MNPKNVMKHKQVTICEHILTHYFVPLGNY